MNLECAICWNLLADEPAETVGPPLVKRTRSMDPASSSAPSPAPEICVPPGCGHMFHKICIAKWIRQRNFTCPICRMRVTECQLITVLLPPSDEKIKCNNCKARLTAEKEEIQRKLQREEKREGGGGAEVVDVEFNANRVEEPTKAKTQIEVLGMLMEQERDLTNLTNKITELVDRLNAANVRLRGELHNERIQVQALEASRMKMQQCHSQLIGDLKVMTKKYQDEQEKANILEERVASLEARKRQ